MGTQGKSASTNKALQQRVKVYRLNGDGKWDDKGTGHIALDQLERPEEPCLYIADEDNIGRTLLFHRICSDDIYRKQEDTILSWRDPECASELALSFQETSGCSSVWDTICTAQRTMHFNTLNRETYHNDNNELRELPPVELSTLSLIHKIIVESGIADQFRVTDLLLHDQFFIQKLMDLFRICEDLENIDGLHMLFKIVRGIISLNSNHIFERIFGDEYIIDIIGCLEYDSDVQRVHHRDFLREHVVFKEAIPIKDPLVRSKIHQTYRVGYLKDVILSKLVDDGLAANLNSIINSNNGMVVSLLRDDSNFIQELFARLKSSNITSESKENLVHFLHEFCTLSKCLQSVQQLRLFRDLVTEGVFDIIADVFRCEDKKLVLMGADILVLFINQDSNLLRSYVARPEGTLLFGRLVKGMLTDFGDDMHCQFYEILRTILDSSASASGTQVCVIQKENILDIFYEKQFGQLIDAITSSCLPNIDAQTLSTSAISDDGSRNLKNLKPEILINVCDLLCFCILHHAHRIKCNFLVNNVIDKVLLLTRRREKYLVVAAVRFVRTLISHNDEHVMNHIVKNNALKPIIDSFVGNSNRYNLLNSAVLELFEYIRKENLKTLVKYLVDTFWEQLVKFDNLASIRSLKVKYDQAIESTGSGSNTNSSEARKRVDERALEKEEEDYFNVDSDEEDSASASMANTKRVQSQPSLPNSSLGSPSSKRPGGLVDYEDDEDDEEYKPPPKRQPESSDDDGEDGFGESLLVKRKFAPHKNEDSQQKKNAMQQLPKRRKLNAFSATLSRGLLLPIKKAESSSSSSIISASDRIHSNQTTSGEVTSTDGGGNHHIIDKEASSPAGNNSPHSRRHGDECPLISSSSSSPKMAVNGS